MGEAQRLLNPWVLHLQKLGLELKCPLCLQLFNRPLLLPCNHVFCTLCLPKTEQLGSECPACKHQYVDTEARPVPFMENIVSIYKNIDATFNANLTHSVCSDVSNQCPTSVKKDAKQNSRKESVEIAQEGNSSNGQSTTSQTAMPSLIHEPARSFEKCITPESGVKQEFKVSGGDKPSVSNSMVKVVAEKHIESGVDGIGFIQLEQLSPPLSSDSKDMDGNCSDPSSSLRKHSQKRPVEEDAHGTHIESNNKCTSGGKSQNTEVKKLKKTNDELPDKGTEIIGHPQTNDMDPLDSKKGSCAFCHTSKETEGSGPMVSYAQGKEVVGNVAKFSKVTHAHEKCITWAPQIFFKDGIIKNLESEILRANKLKCSSCGEKGAVLGCYMKSCQRSYHVPCAYDIDDCRWDCDDLLLLCPKHMSHKFPNEKKSKTAKQNPAKRMSAPLNPCTAPLNVGKTLVLCGSALSSEQKGFVIEYARSSGALVSKYWRSNVTHVIAATNSNGACTRTLKVLMAILNGKWVVTVEWVKACVEAGCLVNEEPYEVHLDTHGCSGGPKAGRLRVLNNGPKLFNNMKFYFIGDFVQAFKTDLLNLVRTGGGTVLETKDQLMASSVDEDVKGVNLVVYNADLSDQLEFEDEESLKYQRLGAAEDMAQESGSQMVGHTWILESIAACSLLPFTSRA